jgi:hypothetical protein
VISLLEGGSSPSPSVWSISWMTQFSAAQGLSRAYFRKFGQTNTGNEPTTVNRVDRPLVQGWWGEPSLKGTIRR